MSSQEGKTPADLASTPLADQLEWWAATAAGGTEATRQKQKDKAELQAVTDVANEAGRQAGLFQAQAAVFAKKGMEASKRKQGAERQAQAAEREEQNATRQGLIAQATAEEWGKTEEAAQKKQKWLTTEAEAELPPSPSPEAAVKDEEPPQAGVKEAEAPLESQPNSAAG